MVEIRSSGGGDDTPKRVVRTGLAVVHENELVYPAAGSEAQAVRVADDAQAVIHMYFPVEIEVRGQGEASEDVEAITDRLLAGVAQRLRNIG